VNRKEGTAIVAGLNVHKKAVRRTERTQGGLIEREFPIRLCKLMPYDADAKKGSRVGTAEKDGKKARRLKASGKII
jgi:ribosomal protein L24